MVFHEITKAAIQEAAANPRELDHGPRRGAGDPPSPRPPLRLRGLAGAVAARCMSRLSAGRVQSVATRLVVDRGNASGWPSRSPPTGTSTGTFDAGSEHRPARCSPPSCTRSTAPASPVARNFGPGRPAQGQRGRRSTSTSVARRRLVAALADTSYDGPVGRGEAVPPLAVRPLPHHHAAAGGEPQARHRARQATMQRRADASTRTASSPTCVPTRTTLSEQRDRCGPGPGHSSCTAPSTCPTRRAPTPSKVKNAQEAHEAIRPAGDRFRTPAQTGLTGDQFRLYELIWKRTVASQMKDAVGQLGDDPASAARPATGRGRRLLRLRPGDHVPRLPQGLRRGRRRPERRPRTTRRRRLPQPAGGRRRRGGLAVTANGHATKPPARYTEATLIKELEDREIGRPSTYASIIGTILNRGYVYKKGTALVPACIAFSVVRLLTEHFTRLDRLRLHRWHGDRARRHRPWRRRAGSPS